MIDAAGIMRQAWMTSNEWTTEAAHHIDLLAGYGGILEGISMSDKAILIAAMIQASAQDQHTMTMRSLAEQKEANL